MEDFRETLCLDIEEFILTFMQKMRSNASASHELQEAKKDNMSLLIKLEKKDSDYQKVYR